MGKRTNMIGERHGDWLVEGEVFDGRRWYCVCVCVCGKRKNVKKSNLTCDRTAGCGCRRDKASARRLWKHGERAGHTSTPEYRAWRAMRGRCENQKDGHYSDYGGRGIKVCARWKEMGGFTNFLADMGRKPEGAYSLDRVDNEGDYKPENCRWATIHEQNRNKRSSRFYTCGGKTQCLQDWATSLGHRASDLSGALKIGFSMKEVVDKIRAVRRSRGGL